MANLLNFLEVCNKAYIDTQGGDAFAYIFNNLNSIDAQRLFMAFASASMDLGKHNFQEIQQKYSFQTISNIGEYQLPADYKRALNNSTINETLGSKMRAVSKSTINLGNSTGAKTSDSNLSYSIVGDKFYIYNLATAGQILSLEYISSYLYIDKINNLNKKAITSDIDYSRFDDDVIVRGVSYYYAKSAQLGDQIVATKLEEFRESYQSLLNQQGANNPIDFTGENRNGINMPFGSVDSPPYYGTN